MENASKALIIAGAILISILLIAVSMYIYNASQDTIGQAGNSMNQQAKSAYNSEIESYLGNSKNSNDVKALIQSVINSNNSHIDEPGKFIAIDYTTDLAEIKTGYKVKEVYPLALKEIADASEEVKEASKKTPVHNTSQEITENCYRIGDKGSNENGEKYVNDMAKYMSSLKGEIKSNKKYSCTAEYEAGIITLVIIQ